MPKSLSNFQADRAKFSPKKQRLPAHVVPESDMVKCKLHDVPGSHKKF